MLRNSTIRTKLALLLLVPLLALGALGWLAISTINAVKIGSEQFDEIQTANNVVADFLPPPSYLIEAHLELEELSGLVVGADEEAEASGAEIDEAAVAAEAMGIIDNIRGFGQRFDSLHKQYEATIEVNPDYAAVYAEMEEAYDLGTEWLVAIETQLVPLLEARDFDAIAALDDDVLNPLFDRHRRSAQAVTELAAEFAREEAAQVAENVDRRQKLGYAATALLTLAAIGIAIAIARSIVGPLRRLTEAARRANDELPAYVASVSAAEEGAAPEPVGEEAGKEMGTLAVALNSMQTTAVELAADQARLRRNVSTMLGNLARRNQALANRTLTFITRLERDERDPDALGNLYKLDHLTTRMRRNAESLLVLSGAESARSWTEPIPVADVLRASLSEIESYERVQLTAVDEVLVRGSAVADIAHLLAELLDNATRFSPPNTTVSVVGKRTDYGYLVSIIDQGLGMSQQDIARANRELESIGRVEERTTMVLGLAVVGRLAARNGITVRLSESPYDGVTAQVRLPHDLVQTTSGTPDDIESDEPVAAQPTADRFADSFFRERETTPAPFDGADFDRHVTTVPAPVAEAPAAPAPSRSADPSAPLPRRTSKSPSAPAPRPEPVAAAAPQAPAPAARNAAAQHDPAAPLAKRVRGANLFDSSLPEMQPAQPANRSADSLRSALSSFQRGFNRAGEESTKQEGENNE